MCLAEVEQMAIDTQLWGDSIDITYASRTSKSIQNVYQPNAGGDNSKSFYSYKIKHTPEFDYINVNVADKSITKIATMVCPDKSFVLNTFNPFDGIHVYYGDKGKLSSVNGWKPDSTFSSANGVGIITNFKNSEYLLCVTVAHYTTTSGAPNVVVSDWDTYNSQYPDHKICAIMLNIYYGKNGVNRKLLSSNNRGVFISFNCTLNYNNITYYTYPSVSAFSRYSQFNNPFSAFYLYDGYNIELPYYSYDDLVGKTGNNYIIHYPILGGYEFDYMMTETSATRAGIYKLKHNPTTEQILEIACQFGFYVTTSLTNIANKTLNSNDVYLGNIDNSVYNGTYTQGANNTNNPRYGQDYDTKNINVDWNDPNDYTNKIDLNKPNLTTTGIFNRTFAINATNVNTLSDYLWNADESIFDEIVNGLKLMGGNPIDGLVDLRLYPFDVAAKAGGGISQKIVIGRTQTSVNAIKINNYNAVIDLGSCSFYKKFNNFLDYEPFTTASLYIPYVGIVPISTAIFVGKNISCKMVVDITTGSCTAIVFCNDIPMIYKNGTIGVEIPMTATNSGQYASRIVGGLTSAATDLTLGASTGNIGQMISGVGNLAESSLNTGSTIYNTAGTSSPSCSLWEPQNCYFIIQRPITAIPNNYGHDVGYACNYNAKISDLSGYTQTYNADVSTINAPENEKSLIANILNSGFYA